MKSVSMSQKCCAGDLRDQGPSYIKRVDAGSASSSGVKYECLLHCMVALNAFSNKIKGEQTYEELGFGCLDDLCFKYNDGESGARKLILLQAKHSKDNFSKIIKADFEVKFGANRSDWSLPKYFLAFLEGRRSAKVRGECINHVVLFTNKRLSDMLMPDFIKVAKEDLTYPLKELLQFRFCEKQIFYRYKDHPSIDLLAVAPNKNEQKNAEYRDGLVQWCKDNEGGGLEGIMQEFLNVLIFAVCQPDVDELEKIERRVVSGLKLCEGMSEDEAKLLRNGFNKKIKEWMNNGQNNSIAWTFEKTEECLQEGTAEVARLKIKGLTETNVLELKQGVSIEINSPQSRFEIDGRSVLQTGQLSVDARLAIFAEETRKREYRLLKAEQFTDDLYESVNTLQDVTVVIVHQEMPSAPSSVDQILQQLKCHKSTRIIILTNQCDISTPLPEISSKDLSEDTIDRILEQPIMFQGKRIEMKNVVSKRSTLRNILNPETLELLSLGQIVVLGKDIPNPPEPYIYRHLTDSKDSPPHNERKQKTNKEESRRITVEEDIIVTAAVDKKHVIVIAPPGSGKSTLALSLWRRTKDRHPAWWVGHCDLRYKMTALGKYKEKRRSMSKEQSGSGSGLIECVWSLFIDLFGVDEMEKILLEDRLKSSDSVNVVLIIDSYDEIECMYGNDFKDFLGWLKIFKGVCLCAMTREHLTEKVQGVLEKCNTFFLGELNYNDQVELLSKLLPEQWNQYQISKSMAEYMIGKLPFRFCANPQHLIMVSEALTDTNEHILECDISLYRLYHCFVQKKFDCYWGELKDNPKVEAEKNTKLMEDDHKQVAICRLLGVKHEWIQEESTMESIRKRVQEKNVGLCAYAHGHLLFVHESYAEYFMSWFLYEKLEKYLKLLELIDDKFVEIMCLSRFESVRRFLDGKLLENPILEQREVHSKMPQTSGTYHNDLPYEFIATSVKEKLSALSVHLWQFSGKLSKKDQQEVLLGAIKGDLQLLVEAAIRDGMDVNEPSENGFTLLHVAAREGTYSMVQLLIKEGCNVAAVTNYGHTVLHMAARGGDYNVVNLIIEKECDVKAVTEHGETALHYSIMKLNDSNVARLLIQMGCDVNAVTSDGSTALHLAAPFGTVTSAKLLTEKGCNIDAVTKMGETALHNAICFKNSEVAALLIEKGSNVNVMTNDGTYALQIALQNEMLDIVELLITHGCNTKPVKENGWNNGVTGIHIAAKCGSLGLVNLLIEKGCDVNQLSHDGETTLHCAVKSGNLDVVKLLVEKGCNNIDGADSYGKTALHYALSMDVFKREDILKAANFFIQEGCDINASTANAETALHFACEQGNPETVKLLLDNGCDTNATTANGETALHYASKQGNPEIVNLLLENGCDANATTANAETALHFACEQGNPETVKLLLKHGCDVDARTNAGRTMLHFAARIRTSTDTHRIEKGTEMVGATAAGQDVQFQVAQWPNIVVKWLIEAGCDVAVKDRDSETALHVAVRDDRLCDTVELLLQQRGCDMNAVTNTGETALHIAASGNNVNAAALLINSGCKMNAVRNDGRTALHMAIKRFGMDHDFFMSLGLFITEEEDQVSHMLIKKGCDVNSAAFDGETPIYLAAAHCKYTVLDQLIEHECNVNAATHDGVTALHAAASQGYITLANLLVANGCETNARTKIGRTPLHAAARHGRFKMLKFLLEKGCDAKAVTNDGETLLHMAVAGKDFDLVKKLLEEGCNINASISRSDLRVSSDIFDRVIISGEADENHIRCYMKYACYPENYDFDIIHLLIGKGCDVNAAMKCGGTALHLGALVGNSGVVNLLIDKGCDVRAVTNDGSTVLHMAARGGDLDVVKRFIEMGCDVNAVTSNGSTALHFAVFVGTSDVVDLLVDEGCDVRAVTNDGSTVLHMAARRNDSDIVKRFINMGCDVNAVTHVGETALHVAARKRCPEVAKLLIDRGCNVNRVSDSGWTAYDLAVLGRNGNLIDLLATRGCSLEDAATL